MSHKEKSNLNSQAVPFFARYLENQFCEDLSEAEMDKVQGGLSQIKEIALTMKYPSDNEDGSDGVHQLTKKYPSDLHEAITNKFPSDGDDELPPHFWER